ncbi:MAG: ribonuclease H-like domain-containing protein [Parcubacteria group bacterium]|nr:ribonuclease H-like domain-containing protein [Parcubacteria group bacterium]
MTKKLVFDIETAAEAFDSFDETSQKLLEARFRKYAKTDEEVEEAKERLTFSPLTSFIVAVGMLDADSKKGAVYFVEKEPRGTGFFEENGVKFEPGTEAEVLQKFWQAASHFDEFITFGGRTFDAPFLMIRSAIHDIRPTKNLMPNRYLDNQPFNLRHVDLQDQFGFYSAKYERLGLHFWCRAFNIPSPKTDVTGDDVSNLFHQGKSLEIAKYCLRDVEATLELYRHWEKNLRFG